MMLDDSDLDLAILVPDPKTPIGCGIYIIFVLVIAYFVFGNHAECAKQTCADGQVSQLLDGQCLCTTKPLPKGTNAINIGADATATAD